MQRNERRPRFLHGIDPLSDHVLLKLDKGDVITLIARGGQKTFQLKGNDPDHRIFKLYSAL